jgi:hypothetical protein
MIIGIGTELCFQYSRFLWKNAADGGMNGSRKSSSKWTGGFPPVTFSMSKQTMREKK